MLTAFGCSGKRPAPQPGHPAPYKVLGKWYQPIPSAEGFRQKGIASWYGDKFHGKKTANGEIYNMHALTAAHKTLPLGTWVVVKNLRNKKTVTVRVNDRGPFVEKRIIDLSHKAARKIDMVGSGTTRVEIRAIKKGEKARKTKVFKGTYSVQAGSFANKGSASSFKEKLRETFNNVHMVYKAGSWKVRVGKCSTRKKAAAIKMRVVNAGYFNAFTVEEE